MNPIEGLRQSDPLKCLAVVDDRRWVLLDLGQIDSGSCYIADASDSQNVRIEGFYDGSTGDVYACTASDVALVAKRPAVCEGELAVHVIGSLQGPTGQVTVRQEKGNYLRICRWDRLDSSMPELGGASLRTLPQCGCGGSLGSPKLFGSFVEMSAYHFCAFYLT